MLYATEKQLAARAKELGESAEAGALPELVNKETRIEDQKHIRTVDGTLVQSDGERRITEWFASHGIVYRYDARLRIIEGFQIRPDFYLPEYDVYIEYWGMDTPRYKAGMYLKQDLYMHAGKRLISLYPEDKSRLDDILAPKLAHFGRSEVRRT
jgi:hypothetical protein